MFFLLSGEGPTDMGRGQGTTPIHSGERFLPGPMAHIVDMVVQNKYDYSMLETDGCGYVSNSHLVQRAKRLSKSRKKLDIPGKKRTKETGYFFKIARAMARLAMKPENVQGDDEVIAVLFHDSDDKRTATNRRSDDIRKAMRVGFEREGFHNGVPMIPKPISEAWLICVLKGHPHQGCESLEERSGKPNASHPLKDELDEILGEEASREVLCERVVKSFNIDRIKMPSFKAFRDRLEEVI